MELPKQRAGWMDGILAPLMLDIIDDKLWTKSSGLTYIKHKDSFIYYVLILVVNLSPFPC